MLYVSLSILAPSKIALLIAFFPTLRKETFLIMEFLKDAPVSSTLSNITDDKVQEIINSLHVLSLTTYELVTKELNEKMKILNAA